MKECIHCKETKELVEFNNCTKAIDGKDSRCKVCTRERDKLRYKNNRDKFKQLSTNRTRIRRKENKKFVSDYLKTHPCVDCGESDPIVLEFDHIGDNKTKDISQMMSSCIIETIAKEIEKCEVRCANCHRRKTAKQFGWTK